MVTWSQGWGVDNKGSRGNFWGDGNVLNVDGVGGGYRWCTLVKTHQTVYVRWMHRIVGNFYLHNIDYSVFRVF